MGKKGKDDKEKVRKNLKDAGRIEAEGEKLYENGKLSIVAKCLPMRRPCTAAQ